MGGEDLEIYGLAVDALVAAGDPRRLVLDLALDVAEVGKPPVRDVVKFGPFIPARFVRVAVGAHGVLLFIPGDVDELENERSPGDDAAAAGKEISADDVLEHRRLARRLGADDDLAEGGSG
jgi:hypothetical protein